MSSLATNQLAADHLAADQLTSAAHRCRLIYLHGFNSAPASTKARQLQQWLQQQGLPQACACPALPHLPQAAIAVAEQAIAAARNEGLLPTLIGSSLGGYYATWLAERHDLRAVLINPAVDPHIGLRPYLGPQQNLYTAETYLLDETHLAQWHSLWVELPTPSRYLLLLETGDEVLDYRQAVARYAGAQQVVVQGGDHSLRSFAQHLPAILQFASAGLAPAQA